ncbi:MAG TPA: DNA translocase FtsK [Candidatus Eisenbacteria bacterium]|nr:DNA translocase FtsK [Candidatus Eisenbacteria bacterium]
MPAREAGVRAWRTLTPARTVAPRQTSRRSSMDDPQGGVPPRVAASTKRQRLILGVLLTAFAGLSLASLASWQPHPAGVRPWAVPNACGPVGATLAQLLVRVFGRLAAFGVPALSGAWAWNRFRGGRPAPLALTSAMSALLLFEVCMLFGLAGLDRTVLAGGWGFAGALVLRSALGAVGSWIVAGTLFVVSALAASEMGFHWIGHLAHHALVRPAGTVGRLGVLGWHGFRSALLGPAPAAARKPRVVRAKPDHAAADAGREPAAAPRVMTAPMALEQLPLPAPVGGRSEPRPKKKPESRPAAAATNGAEGPALPPSTEPFPALSLLSMPVQQEDLITAEELRSEADLLVRKLMDFDIEGRVTEIHPGPVVTTFEFEPAAGVKVNQIVSREDDLALALRAQRIRILAPIPGKGAVGVEIPNRRRRTVYLREVLSSDAYATSDAALRVPLGVDVVGQPFVTDITKMPHVLVAGATGSGKSVCLNAIITGLLFQHGPETLQMVMIDPKMLELSAYNGIPHLVMPVVTEPKRASRALRWAVSEMEKRYRLMATCGARHIAAFNEKVAAGQVPTAPGSEAMPERLSYVVVVIDELADLMLTAPAEIEEPIARLAQMARAVGIHLVLATQRPSVDVITGVIKANFPSRIAFQVASKTDSRTVLDMNGAENLLGHGDMLFTPAGKPEPYRVHGAFVSEEETARVVEFWRAKANPAAPPPLATDASVVDKEEEEDAAGGDAGCDDELLQEAARLVITHQQGSTSLLQRRLKVGYSRAGRLMDQLETIGVVGPFQGSKARDVLVDERWLEDRFA